MTWTPEIVRARFVEACDTIRRLPAAGVSTKSGVWPEYLHTFEDMAGWGAKRLAEEREMRVRRLPASPAAISRCNEVHAWSAELINDDTARKYLWGWAWCRMYGSSFADYCRSDARRWTREIAYQVNAKTVAAIVHHLGWAGVQQSLPDERWLLQECPKSGTNVGTMGLVDVEPLAKSPTAVITERPRDMLTSAQAVKMFGQFLEKTNNHRRGKRERKAKRDRVNA